MYLSPFCLNHADTYSTTAWDGIIPVGTVTYKATTAHIKNGFWDWLVTYDTTTNEIIPVAQNAWTQDDISSTPDGTVSPETQASVFAMPVTGSPFANDVANTSAITTAGTATTTFSK
jgi:hypothetical protein